MLHLTADFGVKTNAKLTPDWQLREKEQKWYLELSVHSNSFCVEFPDDYSLIYNFSDPIAVLYVLKNDDGVRYQGTFPVVCSLRFDFLIFKSDI